MHQLRNLVCRLGRSCAFFTRHLHSAPPLAQSTSSLTGPRMHRSIMSGPASAPARAFSKLARLEVAEDDQSIDNELSSINAPHTGTKRKAREASIVLEEYEGARAQGPLGREKYLECLSELAAAHRYAESLKVFGDMKAAGLADAKAYSYVVTAARPTLHFYELRFLFGEPLEGRSEDGIASPTVAAPALGSAVGEGGETKVSDNFVTVCKLLEEMKEADMKLEPFFYDDLMASLAAGRQAGIMINICTTLEKRGITPSIHFYNQLLLTLPKKGFLQRASALYDRLVMRGMANYQSHLIRLNWLATSGRMEDACEAIKELEQRYPITRVAYNILILGYLKLNQSPNAYKVYEAMKTNENAECRPDRVTMSTFLSHFYTSGDLNCASEIMADLKTYGFPRTARDYGQLFRLNARYDPSAAMGILNEAIANGALGPVLCNDMLRVVTDRRVLYEWRTAFHDAFLKACQLDGAAGKGEDGLAGFMPERPDMNGNGRDMARELLAAMEAKGWEPSNNALEYVLRRMILQRDARNLAAYEAHLKTNGVSHTWNMRNLLLQASLVAGDRERARLLLDAIIRAKFPLTANSLAALDAAAIPVPPNVRRLGSDADSGDPVRPAPAAAQPSGSGVHVGNRLHSGKIPIGI